MEGSIRVLEEAQCEKNRNIIRRMAESTAAAYSAFSTNFFL